MAPHRTDIPQPDPIVHGQPGDCPHTPEFEPFGSMPNKPNDEESQLDGQPPRFPEAKV